MKISVDGGSSTVLTSRHGFDKKLLAVESQTLYWIDQLNIGKISTDGGTPINIVTTDDSASSLTVSGTDIFWTNAKSYIFMATPD